MVAQTRKIKADCGAEPGGLKRASGNCAKRALPGMRMPALPPTPSMSSPKVTSTLANTEVLAVGLKKVTPADTSPHTSCRSSLRVKLVPVVTSVALLSSDRLPECIRANAKGGGRIGAGADGGNRHVSTAHNAKRTAEESVSPRMSAVGSLRQRKD